MFKGLIYTKLVYSEDRIIYFFMQYTIGTVTVSCLNLPTEAMW